MGFNENVGSFAIFWAQGSAGQAYWSVAVYTSLAPLILSALLTHACSSPVHPDPLSFPGPGPSTQHPMMSFSCFQKMSDGKFYTIPKFCSAFICLQVLDPCVQ